MFNNKIKLGFLFIFLGIECLGAEYGQWSDKTVSDKILNSFQNRRKLIEDKRKDLQYNVLTTNLEDYIYIANVDPDKTCRKGYRCFRDIMGIPGSSSTLKRKKIDLEVFQSKVLEYLRAWKALAFDVIMELSSEMGSSSENPFKARLDTIITDIQGKKTVAEIKTYISSHCKGYFHTEFLMLFDRFYDQTNKEWTQMETFNICSYYDMCRICESLLAAFCLKYKRRSINVISYTSYDDSNSRSGNVRRLKKYKSVIS